MSMTERNLYVGAEPEGKYAQGLKLLLAGLMRRSHAKGKPFLEIKPNGCWQWIRCLVDGYGQVWFERRWRSHRLFYEKLVGPIPEGLQLDHICRNRACCNPGHLESVTQKENIKRGYGIGVKNSKKTHCPKGHEYSGENVFVNKKGHRYCRPCRREWCARNRRKVKQNG